VVLIRRRPFPPFFPSFSLKGRKNLQPFFCALLRDCPPRGRPVVNFPLFSPQPLPSRVNRFFLEGLREGGSPLVLFPWDLTNLRAESVVPPSSITATPAPFKSFSTTRKPPPLGIQFLGPRRSFSSSSFCGVCASSPLAQSFESPCFPFWNVHFHLRV